VGLKGAVKHLVKASETGQALAAASRVPAATSQAPVTTGQGQVPTPTADPGVGPDAVTVVTDFVFPA